MPRLSIAFATAVIVHLLCTTSQAQLVQVGPGYVKAPFVRVYSHPDGSSYVRAPFVGVFSPGYRHVDWIPANDLPQPEDFAEMDWRELRTSIRHLAANLDAELDRFGTGDLWKVELKTAEIRALVHSSGPPTAAEAAKLEAILARYEATKHNSTARAVSKLNSFRALYVALDEYLIPPEERLRRQLSSAVNELHLVLEEMPTGPGWQRYLALPKFAAQQHSSEATRPPTEPDVAELGNILARYDSVSHDERYYAIAQLPEFKEVHHCLAAYVKYLRNPPPVTGRPAEELPAPAPSPRQR